jgi:Uma2 family endonuclease
MTVVIQPEQAAQAPDWVRDLSSFRRWAKSDDFPRRGWYAYLNGGLWADPTMETLEHNKLKIKVGSVLTALVEDSDIGQFLGDRMLLTNAAAGLSTEPDGMFVSYEAIRSGRARLTEGTDSLELEGSPDMVLEVVSPTSVKKDTVILLEAK